MKHFTKKLLGHIETFYFMLTLYPNAIGLYNFFCLYAPINSNEMRARCKPKSRILLYSTREPEMDLVISTMIGNCFYKVRAVIGADVTSYFFVGGHS